MTIQEVKAEVYYYTGKRIDDDFAAEILDFIKDHPERTSCEIIPGFFEI